MFWQLCFSILEEKKVSAMAIFQPFLVYFGNYIAIFHKTEIQMVILRCLECLYLVGSKTMTLILVKIIFFPCLKMHHFRGKIPKYVLTPQKKTSCHIFNMAIFSKLFGDIISHIIRWNAGKKINWFLNFLLNKKLSSNLSP